MGALIGFPQDYSNQPRFSFIAPPRGLSTPRTLKVKNNIFEKNKINGREIDIFLKDLHHILHARICNNFKWFPHIPKPPRPLKSHKNFLHFYNFYLFALFSRSPFGLWVRTPHAVGLFCAKI